MNRGKYKNVRVNGKTRAEHRVVMERHLGRRLRKDEHVHHVNHVRDDNRVENLRVLSPDEHRMEHGKFPAVMVECSRCVTMYRRSACEVANSAENFCSVKCARAPALPPKPKCTMCSSEMERDTPEGPLDALPSLRVCSKVCGEQMRQAWGNLLDEFQRSTPATTAKRQAKEQR